MANKTIIGLLREGFIHRLPAFPKVTVGISPEELRKANINEIRIVRVNKDEYRFEIKK